MFLLSSWQGNESILEHGSCVKKNVMGFQRWQFGDAAVCNGECLVLEQQQSLESERILVCKLVNEVNVNVLQYVQCDSSIRQEGNVCQMNLSSITRNYRVRLLQFTLLWRLKMQIHMHCWGSWPFVLQVDYLSWSNTSILVMCPSMGFKGGHYKDKYLKRT